MDFIVSDTEDDSREIANERRNARRNKREPTRHFLDKKLTQVAAITGKKATYYDGPKTATPEKFLKWIARRPERKIFFHNVGYDLGAFFHDQLDELRLTMVGGRVIKAEYHDKVFVDSYNLFPVSVKKLGEALGLKKLDFDSTDKKYVFRDCEIIKLAIEHMLEAVADFGIDTLPNTLGALSVEIWQAMGGKNWKCVNPVIKKAIYGGRTEIFHRGGKGNFALCDVNSMYPWALTQSYPGEMEACDDLKEFGITGCVMDIPRQHLAPLPFRRDDGAIMYPTGIVPGVWTNHEIRMAIEHHGAKIKKLIWSTGTDESFRYYKEYVVTMYERRLEAKSEAFKFIYKILMNSFYGRLGMSGGTLRTIPRSDHMVDLIKRGIKNGTPYGKAILLQTAFPLPNQTNYSHAAYVTSYSRIQLLKSLRAVKPEHLIYCDTDSAFFYAPKDLLPFRTSSHLGDMKFESFGDYIETYAPKMYKYRAKGKTRHKAKGVPKRKAARFIENRETEIETEYEAPFKMRESIAFYDRPEMARPLAYWRMVSKSFRTIYNKKRLDGNRWIPLHLSQSEVSDTIREIEENKP